MILLVHICIAVLSLFASGAALAFPSRLKLRASYALIALTLASGFALLARTPEHMGRVCATGLAYLAAVAALAFFARKKMSRRIPDPAN